MNEVTKIHLGREAFTISVDAQHELRSYLNAIEKEVNEKEVTREIEIRMAELLIEHGITKDKVILPTDIDYLKAQLGAPKDFSEDDVDQAANVQNSNENRKLFRDTDNAVIAGVSSGLAKYFGLDVLLIRILFVIITIFTAGWTILLYIVLWLLMPEAKTSSDRLLMAGKPVTVNSLRDTVDRADVRGAVSRANETLAGPINRIFKLILKLIGICFMLFGLSVVFGLIAALSYVIIDGHAYVQNNIFPIGIREHLVLYIAAAVVGLVALFMLLFGLAIFRRKWPIHTWVTGMLVGLILIGASVGGAMAADVYPGVRDRYNSNTHTVVRNIPTFSSINIVGGDGVDVNFVQSDQNLVSLNYYDNPDLNNIKTIVKQGVLTIDTSQFNWRRNCSSICIPATYNMVVTVYSPYMGKMMDSPDNIPVVPSIPSNQD